MITLKNITRRQLQVLSAIEKTGSFHGAAERMGLTPPAVSMAIKSLEESVGAEAIRRSSDKTISFTSIGLELTTLSAKMESQIERSEKTLFAKAEGKVGHVRIGAVSTTKYFVPKILAKASRAFPEIEIDLFDTNREGILHALETRAIDFAVMGRPPRVPRVESRSFAENPHIFVCAPDFPALEELIPQSEVLYLVREDGSGTRILFERYMSELGYYDQIRTKLLQSNETIKQAVMAKLGIALLSMSTVQVELEIGRLCRLDFPNTPIMRDWYVVHHANEPLSPPAKKVFDFF